MNYNKMVKILLIALLAQSAGSTALAQLNCDGVTSMYGAFIDKSRTNGNAYLAPISYTTGAPGPAMAPGVFVIPRASTSGSGNTAWGTTTLAADMVNNRLFYMTADYNEKDLWMANAITGVKTKVADAFPSSLNGYYFVKLAVAPNGYIYSLSTSRAINSSPRTKLIRMVSCATANCATSGGNSIAVLADIPYTDFNANLLYNGDLVFDAYGNMYIFGSEIDPATSTYVKAAVFKIDAADIPSTIPGTPGTIPITKVGDIPEIDDLAISGAALDGAGNYYLATVDQATRAISSVYKGSIVGGTMDVDLLYSATIPNYIISDLGSCSYPMMNILDASAARLNAFNRGTAVSLFWKTENIKNVKSFLLERKLDGEQQFTEIAKVAYKASTSEYSYSDENAINTSGNHSYRIKFQKTDGSFTFSNTVDIRLEEKIKTKVLVTGNPFYNALSFDLTTIRPGVKTVIIYDNTGNPVLTEKINVTTGMNKIRIEKAASLQKGIYFLHVGDDADHQQFKIVKQ